jgi:hypothetical protein
MATEGEIGDLNDARRQELNKRLAKTTARIAEVEKALEHLKQCRFGPSDVEEAVISAQVQALLRKLSCRRF